MVNGVRTGMLVALLVLCAAAAAAQDLRAGVEQLTDQIVKVAPEEKQLRVAVADFPDLQNVTSDLGRYIANRLTTRLIQSPKFFVVERRRLGQVLEELKFSMSDLVDPAKAKQLGQMVGVEAIIIGTVSDLGNQVDIDARVIEIDTSRMLLSATVTIGKDQVVAQLMERGREAPATAAPVGVQSATPSISQPTTARKAVKYQEFPKFRVEVEGLQLTTQETVVIYLTYINKTKEELTIGLNSPSQKTFVLDTSGNGFAYSRGSGLSGGWHAGSWTPGPSFLVVPPADRASASLILEGRRGEKGGPAFHFTSEQFFVQNPTDHNKARPGHA